MNDQVACRLRESTVIEPLVNGWTAWWLTLAPVPSCLHLLHSQVPLLKSYVQNPTFHARAALDPALAGTQLMGIPAERADEVRALLQHTLTELEGHLQLAESFDSLQELLLAEARGQSMEPLYRNVPEPLRGLVELAYDYRNRPFVRVVEGATWRSRYFRRDLQSLRLVRLERDGELAAVMTTPRPPRAGEHHWRVPFGDEAVDRLFRLDLEPLPRGAIRELLGADDAVLDALLTDEPARPRPEPWRGPGVRVRYVGHACALVEADGQSILIDPLIPARPASGGAPRLSFDDLPARIDYALVTHCHLDHYALETLLRLRHRIGTLVVPKSGGLLVGDVSLKRLSRELGFPNVVEVDAYESLPLAGGEILSVPFLGEHGDIPQPKSAYLVRAGTQQILFAADSACLEPAFYRDLRAAVGEIQTVFMNTEVEGSPLDFGQEALFPRRRDRKLEKTRRCRGSTADEGLELLNQVGAKRLYSYAMGLEPWLTHLLGPASAPDSPRMREADRLLVQARERGLHAQRLCGSTDIHLEP